MSAFLHSNGHIDALIRGGLSTADSHTPLRWLKPGTNPPEYAELTRANATEVGRMLVAENIANMKYLYEDRLDEAETNPTPYVYRPLGNSYEPVEILKAADSYAYQCLDRPEWEESEAYQFIDSLRRQLIRALPGYAEANTWSIG